MPERVELHRLMSDYANQQDTNEPDKDEDIVREKRQVQRILASSFFLFGLVNNGEQIISM